MSAPAMRTQAEKLPEIKPWGRTAAYGIPPVAFSNPKLTFWVGRIIRCALNFGPFFLQVASRPCWCENRRLSSEECQNLHPSEDGCICKGSKGLSASTTPQVGAGDGHVDLLEPLNAFNIPVPGGIGAGTEGGKNMATAVQAPACSLENYL